MFQQQLLGWGILVKCEHGDVLARWTGPGAAHCPYLLNGHTIFCDSAGFARGLLHQLREKSPEEYADARVVRVRVEIAEVLADELSPEQRAELEEV